MYRNLPKASKLLKSAIYFIADINSCCLSYVWNEHSVNRCNSSSNLSPGQCLHTLALSGIGGFWYLPTSIPNLWELTRNCAIYHCYFLLCNILKYGSRRCSNLNILYVLNFGFMVELLISFIRFWVNLDSMFNSMHFTR